MRGPERYRIELRVFLDSGVMLRLEPPLKRGYFAFSGGIFAQFRDSSTVQEYGFFEE
jgi:hypothetical protein